MEIRSKSTIDAIAKSRLAMPDMPDIVVMTFRSDIQATLSPWTEVQERNNEPGGGLEGVSSPKIWTV